MSGVMLTICVLSLATSSAAAQATSAQTASAASPFQAAIDAAQSRTVKLYGGALGKEQGYGSGILVSADGLVVAPLSTLLEAPALRVVTGDGRRFAARVLRRDERRQLALLQIDADATPCFELTISDDLTPGDWLIAAGNPFKVAEGIEPVSVLLGVFSGRTQLRARRGTQEVEYEGPVLLTDVIVATPGTAGGAMVDVRGRLVGMIGKAVVSNTTNTWLNYAIPVEEVAAFVRGEDGDDGKRDPFADATDLLTPDLGIRLFDVGVRTRLAYVERVRPDSPARRADVRIGDLVLAINSDTVSTCDDYDALLKKLKVGSTAELMLKRGDEVVVVELMVEGRETQ